MSTITTKLPQGELRWWRLRLKPGDDGNIMFVEYDDVDNPTWMRHTFYDGCEGELDHPLQAAVEREGLRYYLYVLMYRKPSDADWEALDTVELHLPVPTWRQEPLCWPVPIQTSPPL